MERRRLRLLVALIAVAGLTADLVTKIIAVTQLEPLASVQGAAAAEGRTVEQME